MQYLPRLVLAALAAPALAGCITEERIPGNPNVRAVNLNEEAEYTDKTEEQLLEAAEEYPDDARVWWSLGDYYERKRRYVDALRAYEEMQAQVEKVSQKTGVTYTSGLYLIGKTHARLKNYAEAVRYMEAILEKQPEDVVQAALHKDFKEAHYLLGAIYFIHHQYEIAEKHLLTYRELDPASARADTMLMKIDDAMRRGGHPVESSYRPEEPGPTPAPAAEETPSPDGAR